MEPNRIKKGPEQYAQAPFLDISTTNLSNLPPADGLICLGNHINKLCVIR